MDYEQYSKEALEVIKEDEVLTKQRLQELDAAISAEIHIHIEAKMQEIVDQLNKHGHRLKQNPSLEEPGETDFCESHHSRNCGFRVGSNLVISSGYFGNSDIEAFDE